MFLIIALYAICASTFTISKILLTYAKPMFLVGIRMAGAGAILLTYYLLTQKNNFAIQKKDRLLFGAIILFHVYFAYMLDLWALQYLTSSKSSFLYNLSPFLTALFSYFYFSETMTSRKWIGLFIGLSAFLPEFINFKNSTNSYFSFFSLSIPEVVMVGAVASAMYGWTIMRKLIKEGGYSPIMINGVGMIGGGLLALFTSFFWEQWTVSSPVFNVWPFVWYTMLIILVANIVFYNMYGFLLSRYTATFLSFAGFTCPFFAALFGWFFLGETVSWTFFASLFVVCIGLYIFYQEELRQGYILKN